MATSSTNRERRDWTLIIFLLPIGILLMLVAGQIAIRLAPNWSVDGGMQSSLDPKNASGLQSGLIAPISFDITTPMSWFDSYLTPGPDSVNDGISFAPFVILEPSLTPSPTASTTPVTPTVTPTATTITPTWTPTKKPTDDDDDTPTPTAPPTTCTDPAANNFNGPLPCIYPSPTPLVGSPASVPGNTNIGAPDGSVGNIPDGSYVVIDLGGNPIIVTDPSETNYDFVYYELPSGSGIQMDSVILSISILNTGPYYVVFNWGNGTPDNNSNVGDVALNTGTENDNQPIDSPIDTGELYGTAPQDTGILVDVDNAPSNPPAGNYQYLAIQAPAAPTGDGDDGADVDSVEVLP